MEGAMHDSQRCRDSAAECLLAAEEACQPYYRNLHLSMAASWLSLAYEAIDNLLVSWDFSDHTKGGRSTLRAATDKYTPRWSGPGRGVIPVRAALCWRQACLRSQQALCA